MVDSQVFSVGQHVDFLYPLHGSRNILRRIVGPVLLMGEGPNGPYIKVEDEKRKVYRNLSLKKIVKLK